MNDQPKTSELARAVQDVTERAQIIIREEIELATAEITTKATKLAKGAAIGAAAGIFFVFGLIYLFHALAWLPYDLLSADVADEGLDNYWLGYLIVAGVIFLLGVIAGLVAMRLVKKGAPPTPNMAIEEAQLIKQTVSGDSPTPARRDR